MSVLSQAVTFPAIVLPAFIGAAFLLAILLRYRSTLASFAIVLAIGCAGLAVLLAPRGIPSPQKETVDLEPGIEVDMLVSRGNAVELFLNDWQHPPERLPVAAGQRHVYRFTKIPRNITLLRLDPTDVPDARIVIYSLTVKAGSRTVQQFGPAELKNWKLHEVSAPKEEEGGLAMLDTTGDPILWSPVDIQLPASKAAGRTSWLLYLPSLGLGIAALLLALVAVVKRPDGLWTDDKKRSSVPQRAFAANQFQSPVRRLQPGVLSLEILRAPVGIGLLVLLAAASTVWLQKQAAESGIGIEVDMLVSRGNEVDLWCNDWQHPPETLPVVAGQRHVYRFTKVPHNITALRLDPTDLPDARMVIYGVAVRNRSRIFQQFGPGELKNWTRTNLSAPKEEDGGLALTGLNDDPILVAPLTLRLPGGLLAPLSALIETTDGPFLLAIAVFLLALLMRMSTRTGRVQAVMIALCSCVAWPIVSLVIGLNLLPPPAVTSTVGYASYSGYAKANEHLSSLVAMLVCICLGWAFARFAGEDELEEPAVASRRRYVWTAHAVVFALIFLHFLPNLRGMLGSLSGVVYRHDGWDQSVILHWAEMINMGLRPIRDFWYPYSGGFMQILPFPAGEMWWLFHCTVLLWVLYLALLKVTGRRLAHALVIYGLVLTPVLLEMLPGWNRYLLSVTVSLLYVGVCETSLCSTGRLEWKTHLPFAAFVGYAFFYEPTQIVYAGAGIAVHTILSAMARFQGNALRERLAASAQVLKQRLVCVGVPMLSGITASLLFYAANGMLPGLWDFERSIGDQGDYGAWPADIVRWVEPILLPETVFMVMFLLASYAAYRWVRLKGRPDPLGTALIVLCCVNYVAMQKQILRPHVMTQLRLFPYVAILIFGLIVWRERKPATRMAIVMFVGCILGIAVQRHLLPGTFPQDIEAAPQKVWSTAGILLHGQKEIDRVNATLYSRSRFIGFDTEMAVIDNLTETCGLRAEDNVYVLGDYPIFYMLLSQRPPYVSNTYNGSPVYEQQKVLDWFQRKKPRFVIWGTDALLYDDVPHMVRLPLIYTYVVEHYELVRAIGPYHILAERPPFGHAPDLEYWRGVLSDRVDLGHIPALARSSEYTACDGYKKQCDAVLVVKYAQPRRGKETVDIGSFRVQFDVTPGEREYVVNLNRLWFWNPLSRSKPRITSEDGAAQAVMEYRRERKPVLY